MKNGEKQYSLRGLNSVFFGLLLAMIAGIIGSAVKSIVSLGFENKTYDMYIDIGIIAIGGVISWILIIAGLSAVKQVSGKFGKAEKYYIIEILGVIVELGLAALAAYLVGEKMYTDNGFNLGTKVLAIVGVLVVISLIVWIMNLLAVKNLLGGCADVAMEHDDRRYSRKCTRLWVEYILLNIVMAAGGISVGMFVFKVISKIGGMENSIQRIGGLKGFQEISGLGVSQIYGVIALIAVLSILAFVIQILVMVRVRGTYKRFHNVPVKVEEKSPKTETNSDTGKLSELHPFAKKAEDGTPSPLDTIQSGKPMPEAAETKVVDKAQMDEALKGGRDAVTENLPNEEASAKAIDKLFADALKKEEELNGDVKSDKVKAADKSADEAEEATEEAENTSGSEAENTDSKLD